MLAVVYATGRASHARQVKGDDPEKKGYPGPPCWGLGVRLTTPSRKKYCNETSRGCQGPPRAVEPMMMMMMMITVGKVCEKKSNLKFRVGCRHC
jgi:hypothetical protein